MAVLRNIDTAQPHRRDDGFEYRLDVLAYSTADLVQSVGGWLFDRAAQGWEVTVGVADDHTALALRILGLQAVPLVSAVQFVSKRPPARELAVAAQAWTHDAGVGDIVGTALRAGRPELTLWGAPSMLAGDPRLRAASHRLSAAAHVFKVHAISATGVPTRHVCASEKFRSTRESAAFAACRPPGRHRHGRVQIPIRSANSLRW